MTQKLHVLPSASDSTNPVINILRETLAKAVEDTPRSLAITLVNRDGSVTTSWAQTASASTAETLGAIEMLKADILTAMLEDE